MKNISKEDYLSAIYKLRDEAGEIKPNLIAENLEISPAAVTDMLKKLAVDGFVQYKKYKGIKLTSKGEKYAVNMIRKHRLWETFLYETLNMPWEKIHDEAEKLEHSSSDELVDKLEEFLNYPKFDPHGYPIPDKTGSLPKNKPVFALSELSKNDKGIIARISDFKSELLLYAAKQGLTIGQRITVRDKLEFDGSVLIKTNSNEISLSNKIASNIFIQKDE
ncbi:DtxR family transcriptional regulator [Ignavibacterium album JCM 16511]|uniref:Transcriptional regulator MntR n=1 Tax=Ignavibacterium album (strain DSM 19864 / JCM 16511 / NBRC 101810 / Mat9-16) TaxID=945713 RepID=I0AGW3_IGNAJ|nr:metal-dependent transcriptional regulator [Ignavibacterium album]AFH48220.1 DtxR family transcriptional regulator [Ignavibacterium album JCM 16511]